MRQTRSQARVQNQQQHQQIEQQRQHTNATSQTVQVNSAVPEVPHSQIDRLKREIQSFSIVELQTILGYSHLDKSKKSTLKQRCIDLLTKNLPVIQEKIKQIIDNKNRAMYQQNMGIVVGQASNGAVNVTHANGVTVPQYNMAQGYPIHPDVRLKKLAFFDVMATLLKPSTLLPINSQRVQESTYYFHLTPQQATDIASNRDVRNNSKIEHVIQVQLRFCLLETSCEQEDYFPPNVVVKVNNKLCALPNPIPTNKPGVEPKRPPRPVNITTNVKLSPTVANHISVSWCTEYTRGYVISAYLVKKLTSTQLLHRMKLKGVKPSEFTRGLIKEKLNEDQDSDIATTMLKVSLVCPLGKMRMTTPCRASTCSHLQCFDASLYLQMNERKPTWNCPVCDKPAIYENLVIDGYFQEVLASSNLSSDTNEIQLNKDGSWSTHVMKNDANCLDTPSKVIQKVEVISDDIEVITTTPAKATASHHPPTKTTNEPTSTTNHAPELSSVDLTLSDSDDDAPISISKGQLKSISSVTTVVSTASIASGSNTGAGASSSSINNNGAPVSVVATTVAAAASGNSSSSSKINNNNDISIISLDSPSPPSSPTRLPLTNNLNNYSTLPSAAMGVVSSSTTAQYQTPISSIVSSLGSTTVSNYNQMAASRLDDYIGHSSSFQRLMQHRQLDNRNLVNK